MKRFAGFFVLAAFAFISLHAFAEGESQKPKPAPKRFKTNAVRPAPPATAPAKTAPGAPALAETPPAAPGATVPAPRGAKGEKSNRHYVTFRGEIVDFYCYIEKGLTGPDHKECGTRCVAGDICMGLLTTDGDLYMISRDHLRAMDPLSYKGIPDPFNKCTGMISEQVDLSGYAMERKGQRVLEIAAVKKAEGPPPKADGSPPPRAQ